MRDSEVRTHTTQLLQYLFVLKLLLHEHVADHGCVCILSLLSCVISPLIHSEVKSSVSLRVLGSMVLLMQLLLGVRHPLGMDAISLFIAACGFSSVSASGRLTMCDEGGLIVLNRLSMQIRHGFEAGLTSHV